MCPERELGCVVTEFADCGLVAETVEALPELLHVGDASRRGEGLANAQRVERDLACLVKVVLVGAGVREDHGDEEITARVLAVGLGGGAGGMPGGLAALPEVAEAVAEFRGQLGVVEVADEFRVLTGVGSLEAALGSGQGGMAGVGVPGAGQRSCFHRQELGHQPRCRLCAEARLGGAGEAGGLGEMAQERGLVAHR